MKKSESDNHQTVTEMFRHLSGLPFWHTWRGHATNLFFEFGDPRIEYRAAVPESTSKLLRVPNAYAEGSHGLQVRGYWKIFENEEIITGANQSDQQIDSTARCINGRKLERISIDPAFGKTDFYFDFGLRISVTPYPKDMNKPLPEWADSDRWQEILESKDEIWLLKCTTDQGVRHLSFFEDGKFELTKSTDDNDEVLKSFHMKECFEIVLS